MESQLRGNLRTLFEAFVPVSPMRETTISSKASGDWRFFDRLDDPTRTFTVRKYTEIVQWFFNNWPAGLPWPVGVERPQAEVPLPIKKNDALRSTQNTDVATQSTVGAL